MTVDIYSDTSLPAFEKLTKHNGHPSIFDPSIYGVGQTEFRRLVEGREWQEVMNIEFAFDSFLVRGVRVTVPKK